MIIEILDFVVDFALDDTAQVLARIVWPRARAALGACARLAGLAVVEAIEHLDDLGVAARREAADRQLLAQLRRCA